MIHLGVKESNASTRYFDFLHVQLLSHSQGPTCSTNNSESWLEVIDDLDTDSDTWYSRTFTFHMENTIGVHEGRIFFDFFDESEQRSHEDEEPLSPLSDSIGIEEHIETQNERLRQSTDYSIEELKRLLGSLALSTSRRCLWEADFAK